MESERPPSPLEFDAVILGAGGSGLMCAAVAGRRGRQVAVIDHAPRAGGKIIVSGGGRCNFTNVGATPAQYVSDNPHFARSALARYTPADFIALVNRHGVAWHEKKLGQLFCDGSAQQIIDLLVRECDAAGARLFLKRAVLGVEHQQGRFTVRTDHGDFCAPALVVATGGLSLPKLHATGLGYDIARQFGLKLVTRAPALDGFVFDDLNMKQFEGLSGLSLEVNIEAGGVGFRESLLFTHTGLSGPAALQASLHWRPNQPVILNFVPALSPDALVEALHQRRGRGEWRALLSEHMPRRLAERLVDLHLPAEAEPSRLTRKELVALAQGWQRFSFVPARTVGYHKAEVTRGGVDTAELSSKTMEARRVPGLYFIGEVVDVTGWLGGYNYQWAWASGSAAGQAV